MRATVFLLVLLLLAGCVSMAERRQQFAQAMDSWVGRSADDLISSRGPPTNSATLSTGGKVLEYARSVMVSNGGGTYTTVVPVFVPNPAGGGSYVGVPSQQAMPVTTSEMNCRILFRVSPANRVESWSAEGNACY